MHAAEVQNSTFYHTQLVFLSGIRNHRILYDPGQLRLQLPKTLTYCVMCRFPPFVALFEHNLPTLQTDEH